MLTRKRRLVGGGASRRSFDVMMLPMNQSRDEPIEMVGELGSRRLATDGAETTDRVGRGGSAEKKGGQAAGDGQRRCRQRREQGKCDGGQTRKDCSQNE